MIPVDLGWPALLVLAPVSAVAGVAAMLGFLRWTDRNAFRRCTNQIVALVMEQALFLDDPVLVLRAQREMLRQNARLLYLLWRPALIMTVAFALAYPHLEAMFAHGPLRAGDPAVVTAHLDNRTDMPRFDLRVPGQVAVETPPMRVVQENAVCWRIRPLAPVSGTLEVIGSERVLAKRIAAGPGIHYISPLRTRSWMKFLLNPVEPRFASPGVTSIAINYPPASIFHLHWLVWFLAVSSIAAAIASSYRWTRRR